MTRHRSLLGGAAIAVMIALGCPSLTAMASDGTEPPTNETPAQQTDEPSESTDPPDPTRTH